MSRRSLPPESRIAALLTALAMEGMRGAPVPYSVSVFPQSEFDPAGWAELYVRTVDQVRAWGALLQATPEEAFSADSASIVVRGQFAGLAVQVRATCVVDLAYVADQRDRDADVRDLAAAVAAGELAGCAR